MSGAPPAVPARGPAPPPPARKPGKAEEEDSAAAAAGGAEAAEEEEEVVALESGVALADEWVAPDCYRWFEVDASELGDPDTDVVVFEQVDLTVHCASANVFVNKPDKDWHPEKDEGSFDWNVKRGRLTGPPGKYLVSVYGVPSFIDEGADSAAVLTEDEHANWAQFSLCMSWRLLTPEELAAQRAVEQKFASRKESVFDSSHQDAIRDQLAAERAALEEEEAALDARLAEEEAARTRVDLSGTEVEAAYDVDESAAGLLGRGDFSQVRAATKKEGGEEVAVKIFPRALMAEIMLDPRGACALANKGGEGAVEIKEVLDIDAAIVAVMPRMKGGPVARFAGSLGGDSGDDSGYDEAAARALCAAVLKAVATLHKNNILHRSVAPHHALVAAAGGAAKDAVVRFTGFCLAEEGEDDVDARQGGDEAFAAPEMLNNEPSGRAADVWGAGTIIYTLLCGKLPFDDPNSMKLFGMVTSGKFADIPDFVPAKARDLITSLLTVDAKKRPTAQAAADHEWFKASDNAPLPGVADALKKLAA